MSKKIGLTTFATKNAEIISNENRSKRFSLWTAMKHVDWNYYSPQRIFENEFPDDVLKYMYVLTVQNLLYIRNSLPADAYLYPSPLYRGHVRHDAPKKDGKDSEHSTLNKTVLSSATDVFVSKTYWYEYLILGIKEYAGVGLYLDYHITLDNRGKLNLPMFHFDLRQNGNLFWIHTKETGYVYGKKAFELLPLAYEKWK